MPTFAENSELDISVQSRNQALIRLGRFQTYLKLWKRKMEDKKPVSFPDV